ncbi:MAG TPA: ribosome silencing factor [Terriglobia bacterium]|nr:ribosome silencing factor [Terriglobia bacterium]HVB29175.1 ribosome silencing factor [Terriglobia bacterium]
MKANLREAIRAAQGRKAVNLTVLDVGDICSFTDYFLICSGTSTRHTRAISDAIQEDLKKKWGLLPTHLEGYTQSEWILMDYFDFVIHIFSERARGFYDLERLWKVAPRVTVPEG